VLESRRRNMALPGKLWRKHWVRWFFLFQWYMLCDDD